MFFMIKVCVDVRAKQQITKQKDRVFTGNSNRVNFFAFIFSKII